MPPSKSNEMNPQISQMVADSRDRQTHAIIGGAMEVHRELGSGFLEAVYQQALAVVFSVRAIPFAREVELPVYYKDEWLT
jgi:GxxExxY protein